MKFFKILRDIIATALILAVAFGAGYCVAKKTIEPEEVIVEKVVEKPIDLELPGEVEKKIVTVDEVESKLLEMAELTTYAQLHMVRMKQDMFLTILNYLELLIP